jgi:hypothetical protein
MDPAPEWPGTVPVGIGSTLLFDAIVSPGNGWLAGGRTTVLLR